MDSPKESRLPRQITMVRSDPEKLAQALRANLRRRKAAPRGGAAPEGRQNPESAPERPPGPAPEKPPAGQG